jgi:PIN domain nuclease of toxin-antitoxin system
VIGAPLLDTHVWVWWVLEDRRLDTTAGTRLDELGPDERPYLADISLWEVAMLMEKGKLHLPTPLGEWLDAASHPRTVRVVPISAAIAAETHSARALRDPADRLIVASCRVLDVPLLTHDRTILRSKLARRWIPSK